MTDSVVDLFHQLASNEFGFFARVNTVAEVMSTDVSTADCNDTLEYVLGVRNPRDIGSIAVIDPSEGDVIGLLEHTTIMRCAPRYLNTLGESDVNAGILQTSVCHLVTRPPAYISPSASPLEALERMILDDSQCLLVYDDPHEVLGTLTPCDFARTMQLYYRVYQQSQPLQRLRLIDLDSDLPLDEIFRRGAQTARDVMSAPLTLSANKSVANALALMEESGAQHLLVVDEVGTLVGLLNMNDVLLALTPPDKPASLELESHAPPIHNLHPGDRCTVLAEAASSLAKTKFARVAPTSRVSETLATLVETDHEAVIVCNDNGIVGIITLLDILRVFRTLIKLHAFKSHDRVALEI